MDLTGLGAASELVTTVINKIWPDKSEQEKAQIAAAVQVVQGQMEINKAEAGNPSVFVAGWRPFIGWVCGGALAYQYVLRPVIQFGFAAAGHPLPTLPGIDDNLWQLMLGMLGLGGLRTFEKVKGAA